MSEQPGLKSVSVGMRPIVQYFIGRLLMLRERLSYDQWNSFDRCADVICNSPQMKGEGKVKGTFSGDTAFSSTYDFKGTMHGQPVSQRHENSGRWLSADCGNVPAAGSTGSTMPKK